MCFIMSSGALRGFPGDHGDGADGGLREETPARWVSMCHCSMHRGRTCVTARVHTPSLHLC